MSVDEALRKMGVGSREEAMYDEVVELYEQAGGTWEALAKGDPEAWTVLKKCCRAYLSEKKSKGRK